MNKVTIDKKKCIGCGLCATLCESVFEMNGDKAKVKTAKTLLPCAKEAADACPEQAIKIEEI
ncbi:MAG: ferredoxin [Nanoarchaeota archaeon]